MQVDLRDQSLVKIVIGANIGHHGADEIVDFAAQTIKVNDFRQADDDLPKPLNPFGVVLIGLHGDKDADAEVQPFSIEQGNTALDIARILKLLNSAPTRRRTQSDARAELLHRKAAIHLQCRKNLAIEFVEHAASNSNLMQRICTAS